MLLILINNEVSGSFDISQATSIVNLKRDVANNTSNIATNSQNIKNIQNVIGDTSSFVEGDTIVSKIENINTTIEENQEAWAKDTKVTGLDLSDGVLTLSQNNGEKDLTVEGIASTDYVDSQVTEVKNYTDTKVTEAKNYTDTKVTEAKNYTDTKVTEAKNYTDTKVTDVKNYITEKEPEWAKDTKVTGLTLSEAGVLTLTQNNGEKDLTVEGISSTQYVDTKITEAKTEVNNYTDTQIKDAKTEVNNYTDTQIKDAKTEVNNYTDSKVTEVKNYITEKEPEWAKDTKVTGLTLSEDGVLTLSQNNGEKDLTVEGISSTDYVDSQVTEVKNYTDTQITEAKTEVNNYTDTKITEAKTEVNNYTDSKVTEVKNYITKNEEAWAKDTTLEAGEVFGEKQEGSLGSDYTVSDTAGNEVVLKDVVSGTDMKEYVENYIKPIADEEDHVVAYNVTSGIAEGVKSSVAVGDEGSVTLEITMDKGNKFAVGISDIASKQALEDLGTRVDDVETRVGDVENRVTKVEGDVETINKTIGDVNNFNEDIKGDTIVDTVNNVDNKISNYGDAINNISNNVNKLSSRMSKGFAGVSALAALHPMDFDPDDKLSFAAGVGHYDGKTAAAIGAFYRPDEKVMFSVGGTMGDGHEMVNAGVSFSLDRTSHVTNSKTAMAKEIVELRERLAQMEQFMMQKQNYAPAAGEMKLFPDVPENHWAYEYIKGLQAQGIIEGYPDGNYAGDRMMTRYEFAAMLYRAMQKGASLDSKILGEFENELCRVRVDRISGADNDYRKIERVRVNTGLGKDKYGNKIQVVEAAK